MERGNIHRAEIWTMYTQDNRRSGDKTTTILAEMYPRHCWSRQRGNQKARGKLETLEGEWVGNRESNIKIHRIREISTLEAKIYGSKLRNIDGTLQKHRPSFITKMNSMMT